MIDGASYNEAWEMGRKQGLREAAADIEQLRADSEQLNKLTIEFNTVTKAADAEVERLTAALDLERRRLKVSEEALRRALEPKP